MTREGSRPPQERLSSRFSNLESSSSHRQPQQEQEERKKPLFAACDSPAYLQVTVIGIDLVVLVNLGCSASTTFGCSQVSAKLLAAVRKARRVSHVKF